MISIIITLIIISINYHHITYYTVSYIIWGALSWSLNWIIHCGCVRAPCVFSTAFLSKSCRSLASSIPKIKTSSKGGETNGFIVVFSPWRLVISIGSNHEKQWFIWFIWYLTMKTCYLYGIWPWKTVIYMGFNMIQPWTMVIYMGFSHEKMWCIWDLI